MTNPHEALKAYTKAMGEAITGASEAQKRFDICQKKFEVACLEQDDKAIEIARQDLMSAFEATLDFAIKVYKTKATLEKDFPL